ncbi:MAG: rhodanese-like domain-containing protein [Bacteroidales bacterium]
MKIKIISFVAVLFIISAFTPDGLKVIDSKQANKMLSGKIKYIVLDVRTPSEFISGHIKGAINIDINQSDANAKINKLDPKAKYIVYCRTKNRSQIAVDYMISRGFKEVYKIQDGITGWIANGFPVQ